MNKLANISVIIVIMISLMACGSSTTALEDAAQKSTQTAVVPIEDMVAAQVATQLAVQQKPVSVSTAALVPTNAPESVSKNEIQMTEGPVIVQKGNQAEVIFIVTNPNEASAISGSQYTAVIYDETNTVLSTESGYIELILPNEKLPVVSEMFLQEGQHANKVDVQLVSGDIEQTDLRPPLFVAEQTSFVPDNYFPKVTSILKNNLNRSFSDLQVVAVAYDDQGKIIGGGNSFLSFLPGNGQIGVDIPLNVNGTPYAVNLVGTISSLSMLSSDNSQNQSVQLVEYGWSQKDISLSVGFTVKNNDSSQVIDGTQYQVTAYNEAGGVIGTDTGYINYIFPNATTGESASIYLPEAAIVSKVEVQINPGSPSTFILTSNPFTAENVNYLADPYFSKVTGIIKNTYKDKISDIQVIVIGYDQDNKIMGGGFTFVDFVPGNGQNAFELSFDTDKAPARLSVFTEISSMSQIGE